MGVKTTRVRHRSGQQYIVTIPTETGRVMDLDDAHISWRVDSRDSLSAIIEARGHKPDTARRTTHIQHREDNRQYEVTIPVGLADAMRLDGADLSWTSKSRDRVKITVEQRNEQDTNDN